MLGKGVSYSWAIRLTRDSTVRLKKISIEYVYENLLSVQVKVFTLVVTFSASL